MCTNDVLRKLKTLYPIIDNVMEHVPRSYVNRIIHFPSPIKAGPIDIVAKISIAGREVSVTAVDKSLSHAITACN